MEPLNPHATQDRAAIVDDMICDLITALSLKRNHGKSRQRIENYAQSIVRYCDSSHPALKPTASGSVKLHG